MSLKNILEALAEFFNTNKIDYGIIGAFALFSYGYVRATKDIDFITRVKNKSKVIDYLESLGFETTFSSKAFSNHLHPVGSTRVDIMYVEGITAEMIFKKIEKRLVLKELKLPVVHPEHMVAMKLFAIQNNPDRKFKDLADIKEIVKHTNCNKKTLHEYFKKYGQEFYFHEITE
jgi:predicted nucleotidyltransferase